MSKKIRPLTGTQMMSNGAYLLAASVILVPVGLVSGVSRIAYGAGKAVAELFVPAARKAGRKSVKIAPKKATKKAR